jgi:hypothetical protein
MSGSLAQPAVGQPEISVTSASPLSEATRAVVTLPAGSPPPRCEACEAPLTGRAGQRYCNATCRQRAHRGPAHSQKSNDRPLSRDDAVSRLAYAIKSADGLRDGLDALVRIVSDERATLQAMPLYRRQEIARRFLDGLGLKLADTEANL